MVPMIPMIPVELPPKPEPELQISLKLDGDFDAFMANPEARENLLSDVALNLNVPKSLVYLGRCEAGSIIAEVHVANPTDGTFLPPLETLKQAARSLCGKKLAGFPCRQVTPTVVIPASSTLNDTRTTEADSLRQELTASKLQMEYLKLALEKAEVDAEGEENDPFAEGSLLEELTDVKREGKAKDDIIRQLRLSLNQAQKDQLVKDKQAEDEIESMKDKLKETQSTATHGELNDKLAMMKETNYQLEGTIEKMRNEMNAMEQKLFDAEEALLLIEDDPNPNPNPNPNWRKHSS